MSIRSLLIPAFEGIEFDDQLTVALDMAHIVNGHIDVAFIRPDPETAFASLPPVIAAAGVTAAEIDQEGLKAEAAARALFDAWCKKKEISRERNDLVEAIVATWSHRIGRLEDLILRLGRLSDLIIVNRPDSYELRTARAFDTAVFETGRPTLMLPRYFPASVLDHIVVAWNGSLEVTRAVAGAMPLLRKAKRVSVFSSPEQDELVDVDLDLIGALSWHGVKAVSLHTDLAVNSVGAELLHVAANQAATLLIMGAYTHSRVREMLLGGVTRHILRNATLPVLMAH
jgi:nucleotide-binding universal stress UspA family protein